MLQFLWFVMNTAAFDATAHFASIHAIEGTTTSLPFAVTVGNTALIFEIGITSDCRSLPLHF